MQSDRGDKRWKQEVRPRQLYISVELTKVSGAIDCFFLAEKISEGIGGCDFELGFEGQIGKGKRDE